MTTTNVETLNEKNTSIDQEESVTISSETLQQLLQNMTHRDQPVSEKELLKAATLLQEIISSPSPAVEVAKHLDEIDNLLPAIIDLNIQQAKTDGRPDIASGLRDLKTNITLQKSIFEESFKQQPPQKADNTKEGKFVGKVAVFESANSDSCVRERAKTLRTSLQESNSLVNDSEKPDVAVFINPFSDPVMVEKMAEVSVANVPIILDLDRYIDLAVFTGQKSGETASSPQPLDRRLISALLLADLITVSTESFAETLRLSGFPAMTIPDGWSKSNPYWAESSKLDCPTIQLGWFGNSDNLDDLAVIRRPLIRILREFDDKVRIIIVGNQNAYRMFDSVPENLKTFIPCLAQDELPYIINQMDILLMPLRKTELNEMSSDKMLVYAGVKRIPWVASDFPASHEWNHGGMLCNSLEEWHTNLRCLIQDKDLRNTLGRDGALAASSREMQTHLNLWHKAFNLVQTIHQNKVINN